MRGAQERHRDSWYHVSDGLRVWEGKYVLGMPDNAPHALFQNTRITLCFEIIELVVRQRLQGKPSREHANRKHLHDRMIPSQHGALVPEGRGKRQANQHLEEGLRNESRKQRRSPKVVLLLRIIIPGVVPTAPNRARRNAVEEATTPERDPGQNKTLMPREPTQSLRERQAGKQLPPDGRPPRIGDLAAGPQPVLRLDAARIPRSRPRHDREPRVQGQRRGQRVLEDAHVEQRGRDVRLRVGGVDVVRPGRRARVVGAQVEVAGLAVCDLDLDVRGPCGRARLLEPGHGGRIGARVWSVGEGLCASFKSFPAFVYRA